MTSILIVEDEETYRESLAFNLKREGYDVGEAGDGETGLEMARTGVYDLVLLDLMLPGIPGTEVCRKLRKSSDVPVIMVTAKDEVVDRIVGLEIGAGDYVSKPYSFRELLARIRAVLRRRGAAIANEDVEEDLYEVGGIQLWVDRHEVAVDGEQVSMPLREFELLEFLARNPDRVLARNPDRVLTRSQLMDRVWGAGYVGDSKTLDVHVKRLRSKIEPDPSNPVRLVTVRGLGYKLVSKPKD
ncbi:response regulator transcription factor [Actinomyces culturomici]|uniref:response regulator transcription factor n=1 Tax=Actinomyces culturomici TaxID=1926276 RepID=UPI000E20C193|nr:response regulator transcription factor [Actinomyces culturomici]